jgi:hypothetical protein
LPRLSPSFAKISERNAQYLWKPTMLERTAHLLVQDRTPSGSVLLLFPN